MEKGAAVKTRKVVNFATRDFNGSVDISCLQKVIALPLIEAVPSGPAYLIGMINLAGCVVPVIDLCMRMGTSKPNKYTINTPIMICQRRNGSSVGVVVDSVDDVMTIDESELKYGHHMENQDNSVIAAIKLDDKISLLIDMEKLLSDSELYDFENAR